MRLAWAAGSLPVVRHSAARAAGDDLFFPVAAPRRHSSWQGKNAMASRTSINARSKFDVARQRLLRVLDRYPPDEDNDEEFIETAVRRGDVERWADDLAEATDGYLAELFQLAPGAEAEMRRRSKSVHAATAQGSEYAKAEAACAFILEPRFIPESAPDSQPVRRGLGSGAFPLDLLRPMRSSRKISVKCMAG